MVRTLKIMRIQLSCNNWVWDLKILYAMFRNTITEFLSKWLKENVKINMMSFMP